MRDTKFKCRDHIKERVNYGNIVYSREFYQNIANRTNLQRLQLRFENKAHKVIGRELKKDDNIPDKEGK